MSALPLSVLKFGSSVLPDESGLDPAVVEIADVLQRGRTVLAVVSAMGRGTDDLIARARRLSLDPEPAALAALLATGEAASAALLGMALASAGVPATVLDPGRVGPLTLGPVLEGEPYELHRGAIRAALAQKPVAVLPGFAGRTDDGEVSLLGRGGSDLSAIFAAHDLGARECRLLKDVDGIYEHDPSGSGSRPRRYRSLSFTDALELDPRIVQPKAVRYACRQHRVFEVAALGGGPGTVVGEAPTAFYDAADRGGDAASNRGADRSVDTDPRLRAPTRARQPSRGGAEAAAALARSTAAALSNGGGPCD